VGQAFVVSDDFPSSPADILVCNLAISFDSRTLGHDSGNGSLQPSALLLSRLRQVPSQNHLLPLIMNAGRNRDSSPSDSTQW